MNIHEPSHAYLVSVLAGAIVLKIWLIQRRKRISRWETRPTANCLPHLARWVGTRNDELGLPHPTAVSQTQPGNSWLEDDPGEPRELANAQHASDPGRTEDGSR